MPEKIFFYSRDEKYGWLSNFHRSLQAVDSVFYPTNEHYYQSMKTDDPDLKRWIASAPTPFLAMKAGRSLREGKELVSHWENIKVEVMLKGLRAKFNSPKLREMLLATGNSILMEESQVDMFWGCYGENMLGKLLMQVRSEIRENADFEAEFNTNQEATEDRLRGEAEAQAEAEAREQEERAREEEERWYRDAYPDEKPEEGKEE